MNDNRTGDWMQTAHGRMFWPLDPRPEEIHVDDIAASLSKICRYGGHCEWHYSVAQHSVYVSHQVPPEHALTGLMHDATEAYCADVPRPLKAHLAGYREIEDRIWAAVANRFGLPREMPAAVHDADNAVLLAEKAQIMRVSPKEWEVRGAPAVLHVGFWTPEQAKQAFLRRFEELTATGGVASSRKTGPWSVVALLRKPGEPRASYAVRRVVWTDDNPSSEYLERTFGPDSYAEARAEAQRLNDALGVVASAGETFSRKTPAP